LFLVLALGLSLPLPLSGEDVGGVLYCPDGVYIFSEAPLPLKVFQKGSLVRIALPYRRDDWKLSARYVFRNGEMVEEPLDRPKSFPKTQVALIEVCINGRCEEKPKSAWTTHWDPKTRTLWITLHYPAQVQRVSVRLVFGDGDCGGFLYYESDGLLF